MSSFIANPSQLNIILFKNTKAFATAEVPWNGV